MLVWGLLDSQSSRAWSFQVLSRSISSCISSLPRGSINTTIMELGPKSHNGDGLLGSNSIMAVYMDSMG